MVIPFLLTLGKTKKLETHLLGPTVLTRNDHHSASSRLEPAPLFTDVLKNFLPGLCLLKGETTTRSPKGRKGDLFN